MKRNALLFVFVAAFCAAGAYAQEDQTPAAGSSDQTPASSDKSGAAKPSKAERAAKWKATMESGVKKDCSAEIAPGGVCGGKDFGTGLEKCLHENRAKLTDGCKVAVRPRRGMKGKGQKGGGKGSGEKTDESQSDNGQGAPAPAPAQ